MNRFLVVTFAFVLFACASDPLEYRGESLKEIGNYGVIEGEMLLPSDSFPHNNRKTHIHFKNLKTGRVYSIHNTKGHFQMKLDPGEYVLSDFWAGGMCTDEREVVAGMFGTLGKLAAKITPDFKEDLKGKIANRLKGNLVFKVKKAKKTNLGRLLATCLEWNATNRMRSDFFEYVKDNNFKSYRIPDKEKSRCGCSLLQRTN